ncbi:MAG: hypothetical protein H6P98_2832, partial [Candidatus Aminicenantes bacterium]|nr:hypothetical protein [Candidatus Aminicenantes bacterium]
RESGTQFNPEIAAAFWDAREEILSVRRNLNDNEDSLLSLAIKRLEI